jgi:hypothetical protein
MSVMHNGGSEEVVLVGDGDWIGTASHYKHSLFSVTLFCAVHSHGGAPTLSH